jgi:hypothetical protein
MTNRNLRPCPVLGALLLSLAASCQPSDPASGSLTCGTGAKACPGGYYCEPSTNTCWKNGAGPDGGSAAGPDGGSPSTRLDGALGVDASAVDASAADTSRADLGGHDIVSTDTALSDATGKTDLPLQVDSPADAAAVVDVAPEQDAPPPADGASPPDAPIVGTDGPSCPADQKPCNGKCIASAACCTAADCAGMCMTCDSTNTCVPAKGQSDPTGRCPGTCDTTGACRATLGQSCTAVSGGCAAGTFCSLEGICCDKACAGSCEACDPTGTCKPLPADTAPQAGHPACVASEAICAGRCDGSSSACVYPTTTCSQASCTSSVYQAAGTCNNGACSIPAPKTCANACVVSLGGCTGDCSPDALQCSAAGIPQKCNASGAWQDLAACGTGFVCSAGTCTCSKTVCGTSCVDVQTDASNCGQCGHGCQGGTCAAGKCKPVWVASNLDSTTSIIGIDGQYVYYQDNGLAFQGDTSYDARRVSKSATNGSGTLIYTGTYMDQFHGVVGSSLLMKSGYPKYICSIATTTSCTGSRTELDAPGDYGYFIPWHTMAPQYFAYRENDNGLLIGWVSPTAGAAATFTDTTADAYYSSYMASGNSVYWIRGLDTEISLFTSSSSSAATKTRLTTGLASTMSIVDANALSVLLWNVAGGTNSLYRVPLAGAAAPVLLTTVAPAPSAAMATEDAAGVYWFDGDGILNRCSPASCATTKTTVADNQTPSGALFQDTTSLYWLNTSPYSIVRLAK